MATRRSLTAATAAAAGAVLIALSFVPSASATAASRAGSPTATATAVPAAAPAAVPQVPALADTGAVDTTPYLVGGAGFLGIGAALVLIARRRALADTSADTPPE